MVGNTGWDMSGASGLVKSGVELGCAADTAALGLGRHRTGRELAEGYWPEENMASMGDGAYRQVPAGDSQDRKAGRIPKPVAGVPGEMWPDLGHARVAAVAVMCQGREELPLTDRYAGPAAGKRVPMLGVLFHKAQGPEAAVGLGLVAVLD